MNQAKLPIQAGKTKVFSAFELIHSLRKYTRNYVGENLYSFHYTDEVIRQIQRVFNVDLNKRFRKRGDIKKFIAAMKKRLLHYTTFYAHRERVGNRCSATVFDSFFSYELYKSRYYLEKIK